METNIEQNENTNQLPGKRGGMLHFFMLFVGFILFMVVLSFVLKWLIG